MLTKVVSKFSNVEVDAFNGLLVDYAAECGATLILRGIRCRIDYEYELQMALMNAAYDRISRPFFLMANEAHSFISSRLVKELYRWAETSRAWFRLRSSSA